MMTQRDYMRMLARKYGRDNWKKIIGHYAKAEMEGKVQRKSKTSGRTPIEYAFALYSDMKIKGW